MMEECGLAVVTLSLVSVVDDAHKQTVKEENVSYVLHKIIKRWKASSYYKHVSDYM